MPSPILSAAAAVTLNCWAAAAFRYQLPVELLYAIGEQESGHRVNAVNVNRDGSRDLGIMQINSSWLPLLSRYGIAEDQLFEPCTNIQVGAWVLAQNIQRYGYSWEAIGAYNAGPYRNDTRVRKQQIYRAYADKVLNRWKSLVSRQRSSSSPAENSNHAAR